ncbi:MAG: hypothetical protein V5A76_07565, partial [Candidatus Thermoplasmatota archaeon]
DPPGPGGFGEDGGSFVSFDTIDKGISNYSIRDEDTSIFEEVWIDEFGKYDERAAGATYFLKGNAAEIQLYDTPSRILKVEVYSLDESGRNVSFRLGDMEVDNDMSEKNRVKISDDNYSGNLISLDTPGHAQRVDGGNDKFINFTVEDRATFIFRMEMDGFQEEVRNFVRERMKEGRLGAEFRMVSTEEGYNYTSISYRNVNMQAQMRDENKLDMLVSSETLGDDGTLLLLDISSTVMDISSIGDIDLRFDGDPAVFIGEPQELDDSNDPSYTLIPGEEGTHILVNVPEFSTHSITVEYITDPVDQYLGSLTYYIPAAMASGGLVILGLLYKKEDKKKKEEDRKKKRISIAGDSQNYEKGKGKEKRIKNSKNDKDQGTRVRKD